MFEYSSKESVLGKYATDLFASDDIRKFSDVEAIINRKNSETEEFTATHKDGTTFAVEVSSSAVTDKNMPYQAGWLHLLTSASVNRWREN